MIACALADAVTGVRVGDNLTLPLAELPNRAAVVHLERHTV